LDECPLASGPKRDTRPKDPGTKAFSAFFPTLLGLILPKVVDLGIGLAAGELKKMGEAETQTTKSDAVKALDGFYWIRPRYEEEQGVKYEARQRPEIEPYLLTKCLVIVRGQFTAKTEDENKAETAKQMRDKLRQRFTDSKRAFGKDNPLAPYWNDLLVNKKNDEVVDRMVRVGMLHVLHGIPGIYLEAKMELSGEKNAFRIVPAHIAYAYQLADTERDAYDMTITFGFENIGTKEAPGTGGALSFALGRIVLRNIRTPTVLTAATLADRTTGWMSLLPADEDLKKALTKEEAPFDAYLRLKGKKEGEGEIAILEEEIKKIIKQLSAAPIPSTPEEQVLEEARDRAKVELDKYDPAYAKAEFDTKDETAESIQPGDKQKAKRLLTRRKIELERLATQAVWTEKAALAKSGLDKSSLLASKKTELMTAEKAIKWQERAKDPSEKRRPVNIIVQLEEKAYSDKNQFLLTAGELLTQSKKELVDIAKANIEQALKTDAILDKQATLMTAKLTADTGVAAAKNKVDALGPDASAADRLKAENDLLIAKIAANTAYRNAGLPAPYPELP
jgi:hypothetical protein